MAVIAERLVVRLTTAAQRQSHVLDDHVPIGRPELNAATDVQRAVCYRCDRRLLSRHLRCAAVAPRVVQRAGRASCDYLSDRVRARAGRQDPRPARGVENHRQTAYTFCRMDTTPRV